MKKYTMLRLALATAGLWLATGFSAITQAQASSTGGPTPQTPAAVPLAGGASLLAGVGLGLRRLRRKRQAAWRQKPAWFSRYNLFCSLLVLVARRLLCAYSCLKLLGLA